MKMKLICILSLVLFTACKTQEDIRREKAMDNISEKINQTQQISASSTARFQTLEEQITKLTGSVEEFAHNKGNDQKEVLLLKDRINQLEEENKKQTENIKILADKVNEQTHYIEQVIKTLSDLTDGKEAPKKKSEKNEVEKKDRANNDSTPSILNAIALYKEKNYEASKVMFEELLDGKIKKKDKSQALFYMGMIEYKAKKFDDAKIYFSRLYTEIPDSSFAPGALLNLAKSFTQLKAKDEAKQTLDELITRFPKSKEAIEGAKLKTKI